MKPTDTQRPRRRSEGRSRSASRLAVVQALYQMELSGQDCETALREFIAHRLGHEIEGQTYAEADEKYFSEIVRGVVERQGEIDRAIARFLVKEWPFDRIDATMRATMRAAAFEMIDRHAVPARVVVSEYLNVASAFFGKGEEMAFLGGLLNRMAREMRPTETIATPTTDQ
jgi:transcription antitermination protein NusB